MHPFFKTLLFLLTLITPVTNAASSTVVSHLFVFNVAIQRTDYIGNKIYVDSQLDKILLPNGYIKDSQYYFYLRDHLGNNRAVMALETLPIITIPRDSMIAVSLDSLIAIPRDSIFIVHKNLRGSNTMQGFDIAYRARNVAIQRTDYYPSGLPYPSMLNPQEQPYKFNGKEFDTMHGLNMYDYSARHYDAAIARTTTPDPHAENYYSISPYSIFGNNPVSNIDPTGMDYWSTTDPDEIRRFLDSSIQRPGSSFETFNFGSWTHITDNEFIGNLTYNDETNMFYTSYGGVRNGEATIFGVSILAASASEQWATIETGAKKWYEQSSGRMDNIYPEFELFGLGKGLVNAVQKAITSRLAARTGANLLNAANSPSKGGLTAAGRALQKHGSRAGSVFPKATGNPAQMNAQGEAVLKSILENPRATQTVRHHGRFGEVLEIKVQGEGGVRFSADGTKFINFLEP